jgi:hypothetical protein
MWVFPTINYKFTRIDSKMSISILLSKVQKRVAGATRVSRITLCRLWKEGENFETGDAMAFLTQRKLRPKSF